MEDPWNYITNAAANYVTDKWLKTAEASPWDYARTAYDSARSLSEAYDMYSRWKPKSSYRYKASPRYRSRKRSSIRSSMTMSKKRKRSFKRSRKGFLIKRVKRMSRKLASLAPPAKDLFIDTLTKQFTYTQGKTYMTGFGGTTTKNGVVNGFSSSPEDLAMLFLGPFNNNGGTTALGKCISVINSWETIYYLTNICNDPMIMECFTIKCIKDVPQFGIIIGNWETWMNNALTQQYVQLGGAGATPQTDTPGFKFSDCSIANGCMKIVKHKTTVVQPGETWRIRKFKLKPRIWNESKYYQSAGAIAGFQVAAAKGSVHYIFRFTCTPVSSAGGGTTNLTFGASSVNMIQTVHYRHSFLYNDAYRSYKTTALPSGIAEKSIFPGTSTANANAPAT